MEFPLLKGGMGVSLLVSKNIFIWLAGSTLDNRRPELSTNAGLSKPVFVQIILTYSVKVTVLLLLSS